MEDEQEIKESEFVEKKVSLTKKIFGGIGVGGAFVGGGILLLIFTVVRFLFVTAAGLYVILLSVQSFHAGLVFKGILELLIGTPIAIGLASYLFIPFLLISIIILIIWGIVSIFGINTSFWNIWDIIWFVIKILITGFMAIYGLVIFIKSVKEKRVSIFFKENWFYFLLFIFLFWLFFLNINQNSIDVIKQNNINQANQEMSAENFLKSLNTNEENEFFNVLKIAQEKPLADLDLSNLRGVFKGYIERTGNYLKKSDTDLFSKLMSVSNNYQYELGMSLLFSWDDKKVSTTTNFSKYYNDIEKEGYRTLELLQSDLSRLNTAAYNLAFFKGADGNQYEFGREIILQGIENIKMLIKNDEKIISVLNEFVK